MEFMEQILLLGPNRHKAITKQLQFLINGRKKIDKQYFLSKRTWKRLQNSRIYKKDKNLKTNLSLLLVSMVIAN